MPRQHQLWPNWLVRKTMNTCPKSCTTPPFSIITHKWFRVLNALKLTRSEPFEDVKSRIELTKKASQRETISDSEFSSLLIRMNKTSSKTSAIWMPMKLWSLIDSLRQGQKRLKELTRAMTRLMPKKLRRPTTTKRTSSTKRTTISTEASCRFMPASMRRQLLTSIRAHRSCIQIKCFTLKTNFQTMRTFRVQMVTIKAMQVAKQICLMLVFARSIFMSTRTTQWSAVFAKKTSRRLWKFWTICLTPFPKSMLGNFGSSDLRFICN